jgi:ectoine hydroxylase-related dioxygenase (phytanoyl-CoA dioxygenase family)
VPAESAGNFTVWPGSHETMAAHFRAHGPESVIGGFPGGLSLPAPRHLTGHAGDVVLAHYALAHAAAGNASPHVRYAVFFRIFHRDHQSFGTRGLTDPWLEWEGMK